MDNGDLEHGKGASNNNEQQEGDTGKSQYDPKTLAYLEELLKEKHVLNIDEYPHASRLVDEEVSKTRQTGRGSRDFRYLDILREKPVKVVAKVMVPIKEYPKFNFVGKLLGPKGNSLKRLQEDTQCKMSILGRNSMKDKAKEEELRQSLDPKYSHLSDDLHVEVTALASPSEAYGRISYALSELRKYFIPDTNDDISQGQLREMGMSLDGDFAEDGKPGGQGKHYPGNLRGPNRGVRSSGPPSGNSTAKVLSILEKARSAMDYSNNYTPPNRSHYDSRPFQDYPDRGYDGSHFEEHTGGNWNSGFKAPPASSTRVMSRNTPYKRF